MKRAQRKGDETSYRDDDDDDDDDELPIIEEVAPVASARGLRGGFLVAKRTPPPSAAALREQSLEQKAARQALGNAAFEKRRYKPALEHYTAALELAPDDAALLANRAACNLELARFQVAPRRALSRAPRARGAFRRNARALSLSPRRGEQRRVAP